MEDADSGAAEGPGGSPNAGSSFIEIERVPPPEPAWSSISNQKRVNWDGVFRQSSLFLAIQHGFRLATEPGTREGMKGPFFKNYWRSVRNLHGWADGDEFYVNWVGHPMQGAVAGFLFNQNDLPAYRYATFGRDREYWKGRMRSLAYSYAFSAQFEIGALSEASIGRIQSSFPQQGFVDHVVTPAVGMGWMIAEDALDRYLIRRFESRVRNPYAVMLVRGWLNPARSFANVLKLDVPWHRDTRPGIFRPDPKGEAIQSLLASGRNRSPVKQDPVSRERADAVVAPFEFDLVFQANQYPGPAKSTCFGGGGTSAFRLASRWQALLDVGGCKLTGLDTRWSGDSLHYLGGLRWTPWAGRKWSLHAQLLAGGEKVTEELMFPEVKAKLYDEWNRQGSNPQTKPAHDQYTMSSETSGSSVQGGAGLSYRINSALQLRVASVDYRRSWLQPLEAIDSTRSLTFSSGVTLRMGTW